MERQGRERGASVQRFDYCNNARALQAKAELERCDEIIALEKLAYVFDLCKTTSDRNKEVAALRHTGLRERLRLGGAKNDVRRNARP